MKTTLADDLADLLRRMIADGDLAPGSRINEVAVAESLDVSRTPLREALHRLTTDGFVESRPRHGFYVQDLDLAAARSLYELRSILDPAALELAGLPAEAALEKLDELNQSIRESAGDVERVIDLDDAWHLELLAGCENRILLDLIRQFMKRTRPLERAYVRAHGSVAGMVAEHGRIVERLRAGDLEGAISALRDNMQSGLEPILEWLESAHPTAEAMRR